MEKLVIVKRYADGRAWWRVNGEPGGWHGGVRPDWSEVPEVFEPVRDTSVVDAMEAQARQQWRSLPADVRAACGEAPAVSRVFDAARRAQGFTSQADLDAWFAYSDHVRDCPLCGQPAPAHWSDADASWQPCETRCAESHRLSEAESDIRRRETAAIVDAPHVMVTWANAITTGQSVTECFPSRELAMAAAADRSREVWNNTRVAIAWHEAHARKYAREAMYAADREHRHVWGSTCMPCLRVSADREDSERDVIAARDAAGDHEMPAVTS